MLAQVGSPCSDPQSQSERINFQEKEGGESSNTVDIPEVGPNELKQQVQRCSGCPGKRVSGPCYIQRKGRGGLVEQKVKTSLKRLST